VDGLRLLISLLAPPRCAACKNASAADAVLCGRCAGALRGACPLLGRPPPKLDAAWAAAPHEGVARQLVVALKFERLLPVADLIAASLAAAPARVLAGSVVAVPAASSRLLWRGFDPAEEIAERLARITGLPRSRCLWRRDGSRQVGRSRRARLSSPPSIGCSGRAPPLAVLIDDVQTTGATLSACAAALRRGGSERVTAVTFARTDRAAGTPAAAATDRIPPAA
jgi:predicted amidophosphoribosyltransferase